MSPIPPVVELGFIMITLTVLMVTRFVFFRIVRAPWVGFALSGWVVGTGVLGAMRFFVDLSLPPRMPPVVILALIGLLWLNFRSPVREKLREIPQSYLIGIQLFRLPVELLLAELAAHSLLPVEMTFHGRNFDIVTGLTAPVLALVVMNKSEIATRQLVIAWNAIGLVLLGIVVGHGILSVPYPFQVLHLSVDNFIVTFFPVMWLPVFLVPMALFFHIVSLRRALHLPQATSAG